jgi:hypothetical protein
MSTFRSSRTVRPVFLNCQLNRLWVQQLGTQIAMADLLTRCQPLAVFVALVLAADLIAHLRGAGECNLKGT